MIRRASIVLVFCALLAGCATGEEARRAARVVLAEMLQYERLVDRKIAAEAAYYANRAQSLNESLERALADATRLNVASQSNRTAADLIKRGERLSVADVADFVATVLRTQEAIFEQVSQRRHELRVLVTESLAPLDLDKVALQRTRKSLEALQIAPDEWAKLKALYEFVSATRTEYDKLRQEDVKEGR